MSRAVKHFSIVIILILVGSFWWGWRYEINAVQSDNGLTPTIQVSTLDEAVSEVCVAETRNFLIHFYRADDASYAKQDRTLQAINYNRAGRTKVLSVEIASMPPQIAAGMAPHIVVAPLNRPPETSQVRNLPAVEVIDYPLDFITVRNLITSFELTMAQGKGHYECREAVEQVWPR